MPESEHHRGQYPDPQQEQIQIETKESAPYSVQGMLDHSSAKLNSSTLQYAVAPTSTTWPSYPMPDVDYPGQLQEFSPEEYIKHMSSFQPELPFYFALPQFVPSLCGDSDPSSYTSERSSFESDEPATETSSSVFQLSTFETPSLCGSSVPSGVSSLVASRTTSTESPTRLHICGTCSRSFARLEHLKRHERSHTKQKPFECPHCTRCFARRDLLLRHQQKLHQQGATSPTTRLPPNPTGRARSGAAHGDGIAFPMDSSSVNTKPEKLSLTMQGLQHQLKANQPTNELAMEDSAWKESTQFHSVSAHPLRAAESSVSIQPSEAHRFMAREPTSLSPAAERPHQKSLKVNETWEVAGSIEDDQGHESVGVALWSPGSRLESRFGSVSDSEWLSQSSFDSEWTENASQYTLNMEKAAKFLYQEFIAWKQDVFRQVGGGITQSGGGEGPVSGVGTGYSQPLATSVTPDSVQKSKRKRSDDEEEEGERTPQKRKFDKRDGQVPIRLLACPFAKKEPLLHRRCFKLYLQDISRLKQHLRRVHMIPIHCLRCSETFATEDEHDVHIRKEPACEVQPPRAWNGINSIQKRQLEKRTSSRKGLEENWYLIYDLLFPDGPRPDSPYIEHTSLSEDLVALREFASQAAPARISTFAQAHLPPGLLTSQSEVETFTQAAVQDVLVMLLENLESSINNSQNTDTRSSTPPGPSQERRSESGYASHSSVNPSASGSVTGSFPVENQQPLPSWPEMPNVATEGEIHSESQMVFSELSFDTSMFPSWSESLSSEGPSFDPLTMISGANANIQDERFHARW